MKISLSFLLLILSLAFFAPAANAQISGTLGTIYTANPDLQSCVINIPVAGIDVPWVVSGYRDGNYSMVMAIHNLCTLPGNPAGCTTTTGTQWNVVGGAGNNNCSQGPGGRCSYFAQLDNVLERLPNIIGGLPRNRAIRNNNWTMHGFVTSGERFTSGTSTNVNITHHLNLPSYYDWQNGHDTGSGDSPANSISCSDNSLGARFTHARFGHTDCLTQNINGDSSGFNFPWLRSTYKSTTANSWNLTSSPALSAANGDTNLSRGLLPVMWLFSDLSITCGTWQNPGEILIDPCILPENQYTLACLAGKVINIPVGGVDVPWVISGYYDDGYSMVMAMENLCELVGNPIACVNFLGDATNIGSVWNAGADSWFTDSCRSNMPNFGRCNLLEPTSLKTNNFLTQMSRVFNALPTTIGGIDRDNAIRNTVWNMDGFNVMHVRSAGFNAPIESRVNLPSLFEWQVGQDDGISNAGSWNERCRDNSLGAFFTYARFGQYNCITQNLAIAPNSHPPMATGYNLPWLRSAISGSQGNVFVLSNDPGGVAEMMGSNSNSGILPVMYIQSSLRIECGSGTWHDPYMLLGDNFCPDIEPPYVDIFNLYQNQSAWPHTAVNIAGNVTASNNMADTVVVSAEIGGTVKSYTFPAPITNRGFTLTWRGDEMILGTYGNALDAASPIIITVTDFQNGVALNTIEVEYQGRIISRPMPEITVTNPQARELFNQTHTTHAGAIFFLYGTQPNLKDRSTRTITTPGTNPDANRYFCFSDAGCFNLTPDGSRQIWMKEITDYSFDRPITRTFPFLVQFYDHPRSEDDLRIVDEGW